MDEPVKVDLDPEEALRLLLGVERREDENEDESADGEREDSK